MTTSEPETKSELITTSLVSGVVRPMDDSAAGPGADRVTVMAQRINSNWQKSREGIRLVALDCAEGNTFDAPEKKRLLEQLPFKESMFSKLAAIGADQRLMGTQYDEVLTPSISTWYELRALNNDQFTELVSKASKSSPLTRQRVLKWKATLSSNRRNTSPSNQPGEMHCLYSEAPLPAEQQAEVKEKIAQIAEFHGLKAATFTGESLRADVKRFLSPN